MFNPYAKHLHWDFSDPRKKPSGPVEIDWANPLSSGLIRAYCFTQSAGLVDLVENSHLTVSGSATFGVRGVTGRSNYAAEVDASSYLHGNDSYRTKITDQLTAFCDFDYTGGENGFIFGDVELAGADYNWGLYIDSGNDWRCYIKNTGGSAASTADIAGVGASESLTLALTYDGATLRSYKNSVAGPTASQTGNVQQTQLNTSFGGWNSSNDEAYAYKIALVFDRVLSPTEIKSLHDSPYQLLRPAIPLPLLAGSAVSGGWSITDVDLDNDITDGQTGVVIAITGAVSASGKKVWLEQSGNWVEQTVTAEDTVSATITVNFGSLTTGAATLHLRNPL